MQVDHWIWGDETILWGYDSAHRYTLKILEPKPGSAGCLSLQYHQHKSESWIVIEGIAWALAVIDGVVCTKLLRARQGINLPQGVWHRLAAATKLKLLEPSTPDQHAADKSAPKDVVRLHCMHGRGVQIPTIHAEAQLVEDAAAITISAMNAIDQGELPAEISAELFERIGVFEI